MTDFNDLKSSLEWLAERGFLSGSWARGDQRDDSDVDVRLSYQRVQLLKKHLMAQGVKWTSPVTGAITWRPGGVQVEVSDLFPRYKTRGKKTVYGVTFRV